MFPLDDLSGLTDQFTQDPARLIGIPFALVGAVLMSLGAQFQHRGVVKVESSSGREAASGLNFAQLKALLQRPSWVIGTVMLALAIVFQLSALAFSPLILVQPLGAIALVITSVLNARIAKITLNRRSVVAIVACVAGVALFVTTAAIVGVDRPVTSTALIVILVAMVAVLAIFAVVFAVTRSRAKAIFYIVAAGCIYGFVATLAKVILSRVSHGNVGWLTILCIVGLIAGTALGAYFVQNAYASGPPDLVIAGLTVIDPLVAVAVGIIVLREAANAPLWAIFSFVIAGTVAIWGVFQLARHHPQAKP
ncbi:DMT family transporter [Paramicrobacterium agarici]|uniref:Magnesium transporter NIPA n=1 Tax=Paramicrobacterium agarici TaxID=630514 RepID=A0A2A9DY27_9MICO|nr:DMT family transporter [Microbacterium agarici]PFG31231.1 magnesium transporter NIPA [Microbacterium agarici]